MAPQSYSCSHIFLVSEQDEVKHHTLFKSLPPLFYKDLHQIQVYVVLYRPFSKYPFILTMNKLKIFSKLQHERWNYFRLPEQKHICNSKIFQVHVEFSDGFLSNDCLWMFLCLIDASSFFQFRFISNNIWNKFSFKEIKIKLDFFLHMMAAQQKAP